LIGVHYLDPVVVGVTVDAAGELEPRECTQRGDHSFDQVLDGLKLSNPGLAALLAAPPVPLR